MSDTQLKNWAYKSAEFKSVGQDFELTVAVLDRSDIVLELASDNKCPKQLFFLRCAVQIVGFAINDHFIKPTWLKGAEVSTESEFEGDRIKLEVFLRKAEKTGNKYLLDFVWRARQLLENPEHYDEDRWYLGHLADEIYSV